jgi:hypothetical protein
MAQFKALGRHTMNDGTEYNEGQVFEHKDDLDVLFHNKFERIGGPTKPARDYRQITDSTGVGVFDKPEHQRRAVAASVTGRTAVLPRNTPSDPDEGHQAAHEERFAKSGQEAAANAREASQPAEDADARTLEANDPRSKFAGERGGAGGPWHKEPRGIVKGQQNTPAGRQNAETGTPPVDLSDTAEENGGEAEGEFDPKKYEDITEEFPAAGKAEVKVYHGEEGYVVCDKDGNPVGEAVTSKKAVRELLKEQAEDE